MVRPECQRMEMVEKTVQICFDIMDSSIPPRSITAMTGVTPDEEWLKGERDPARGLPRRTTWSLRSQSDSEALSDHWKTIEAGLMASKEEFRKIAETSVASITILINSHNRVPPIAIPPAMAEFAGYVNIVIDIDHLQS